MTSSIFPLTVTIPPTSTVVSVAVILGGSGYTNGETVTLTGNGTGATGTVTVVAGAITAVAIVLPGIDYLSGEIVTFTGTGTGATGTVTTVIVFVQTPILTNSIPITSEQVKPGGGGIVRISFSFKFIASPATIQVFNNDIFKGNLNADNSSNIISDGYYRFDIDVEAGDLINLRSTGAINKINFVRVHLIQFGA